MGRWEPRFSAGGILAECSYMTYIVKTQRDGHSVPLDLEHDEASGTMLSRNRHGKWSIVMSGALRSPTGMERERRQLHYYTPVVVIDFHQSSMVDEALSRLT